MKFIILHRDIPDDLASRNFGEDLLKAEADVVCLYIPGSAARTKLNNAFPERVGKVSFTTRNRNTLAKMAEMSVE